MSKRKGNLVVKTNQLNSALQNLTKAEIRILQLAIVDARETGTGLSTDKPLRIDAIRYAEVFNTTKQNSYARMKDAEETLFNRRFTYIDENGRSVKSRWIQQVQYLDDEGAIELVFTLSVVKGISRINGLENFFTSYLLEQTTDLKSVYAIRLYELLSQWTYAKKTPVFELEHFRGQLGIGVNEYKAMSDFKKRVLNLAKNEINKKTDLTISYKNVKEGRRIIGFKFIVSKSRLIEQSKTSSDHDFMIDALSDKQLARITRHKDFINSYGYLAKGNVGRDWKLFTEFMIHKIKENPSVFSSKKPIQDYLNDDDENYHYS